MPPHSALRTQGMQRPSQTQRRGGQCVKGTAINPDPGVLASVQDGVVQPIHSVGEQKELPGLFLGLYSAS